MDKKLKEVMESEKEMKWRKLWNRQIKIVNFDGGRGEECKERKQLVEEAMKIIRSACR